MTAAFEQSNLIVGGPQPTKILVADDDSRNLLALEQILQNTGCELVMVSSGEEVLRRVLVDDFALILLDVQMPRMDGYEVADFIRKRDRSSHIPIIFLTAYNKDELHVFRGYTAGAVDYVFKPIEPIILQSKVSVFVELHRKTEEVRRQAIQERNLLMENLRVRGEKLRAEQALRREQERQQSILSSLPVVLTSRDVVPPFAPLFVSDNVERLTGFSPEQFTADAGFGMSRVHPEDADRVHRDLNAALDAGQYTTEYRWRCSDGGYRTFLDQGVLAPEEVGRQREIFGTMFDVTERRMLEERLLHGSKLEAIGELTGGIAHDFNNMLMVVIGNLDMLRRSVEGDARMAKRVEAALDGAQRCAALTSRLLSFARRQPLRESLIDLTAFGEGLLEILRRTLGDNIDVAFTAQPGIGSISIDEAQLEAALINLAVNARDAMPQGGRLSIAVSAAKDIPPELEGDFVLISVSDTGSGMPPGVRERIFEPFFTTKEVGRGTGLGLSMTYGFVKQSGGDIVVRSSPGEGTTIGLFLPHANKSAEATQSEAIADAETPCGRGELILIVEDDPDVRQVTASTVEMLGFRVLEAEDGHAALRALHNAPSIAAVLSDVNMPGGLTGIDLAQEVTARWPDIKIMLMTARVDDDVASHAFGVLLKPYRTAELARTLRMMIDGSEGRIT